MTLSSGRLARVGVVGAGWWSTYTHIPALLAHPRALVAGLCDTNAERLRAAAEAFGLEAVYTSLDAMLAEAALDGVIIATPHATHWPLARACLEAGLHVMLEKPMTLHASEARALIGLARDHGRELIMGYPWHYSPAARRARELVHSGKLGAVQYVCCSFASDIADLLRGDDQRMVAATGFPANGPGAVYSDPALSGGGQGHLQITHSAGLMFFVTGLRVDHVLALMRNHGLPLDLVDAMTVAFDNGALGIVGGTGNSRVGRLDLIIRCERGGLDLDVFTQTLTVCDAEGGSATTQAASSGELYPRFAPAHNLVEVCLGEAPNGSPADVGWRTVELLDAAYRSAGRQGQAVRVEELYTQEAAA